MEEKLAQLLESEVNRAGFELYHWLLGSGNRRGRLLKVLIHGEKGVNLDDCAAVSRAIGRALESEDVIQGAYVLEVSSPGMDRDLLTPRHYEIAKGYLARVTLSENEGESRTVEGEILGLDENCVVLAAAEGEERLPLEEIRRARLIPQFPGRGKSSKGSAGGV